MLNLVVRRETARLLKVNDDVLTEGIFHMLVGRLSRSANFLTIGGEAVVECFRSLHKHSVGSTEKDHLKTWVLFSKISFLLGDQYAISKRQTSDASLHPSRTDRSVWVRVVRLPA
jgi:hypothetical protein